MSKSSFLIACIAIISVHDAFSMDEKKAIVIRHIKNDEAGEIEKLIKGGFDSRSTFRHGRTMFHEVVSYNAIKVTRLLLSLDCVDINQANERKSCPLHSLAMYDHKHEIAELFFTSKLLIIDPQDINDFTPLHHAVTLKNCYMISQLIKNGANPYFRDREGENAYDKAFGAPEILALLCAKKK